MKKILCLILTVVFALTSSLYVFADGDYKDHWSKDAAEALLEKGIISKDANGNVLQNGDTVVIIKDLKVKGASSDLKQGTKVKNIRLIDDGVHNIDCNIPGFGAMSLKSEYVKKA